MTGRRSRRETFRQFRAAWREWRRMKQAQRLIEGAQFAFDRGHRDLAYDRLARASTILADLRSTFG